MRPLISRNDDAHSSSVASIEAPDVYALQIARTYPI